MYPDPNLNLNFETDQSINFFTPAFYPLDNFSAHTIKIWGKEFKTVEHAYQWKKFIDSDPKTAGSIFAAGSPELAKQISKLSGNRNSD